MSHVIRKFLRDEKHAGNVVVGGAAAATGLCFLMAVIAIFVMQ